MDCPGLPCPFPETDCYELEDQDIEFLDDLSALLAEGPIVLERGEDRFELLRRKP